MLSVGPSERQKTFGYSEVCQYYSPNIFTPNKRHYSESSLKNKSNTFSKKYQLAPKSMKTTTLQFNFSFNERTTFTNFKTQSSVSKISDIQGLFELSKYKKGCFLQTRSRKEKETIFRISKTQALAAKDVAKDNSSQEIIYMTENRKSKINRLCGKQQQKLLRTQKKYKLLNMVGNRMNLCRIDEQNMTNLSVFLTSKENKLQE